MRRCDVGGQAVIEGVMMRGKKGVATAVRKEDGEIVVKYEETLPFVKRHPKLNIPLIRGIFVLIDSLIEGIKALNYSSEFFIDDDEEPSKFDPRAYMTPAREQIKQTVQHKIKNVFGSSNKAWKL